MKIFFDKKTVVIWVVFAIVVIVCCGIYINSIMEKYSDSDENKGEKATATVFYPEWSEA